MAEGRLGRVAQRVETILGIASKNCLMVMVAAALVVGVAEIVRACHSDAVVLEPVIVKGGSGDGSPTVEMATQQIATYLDRIQLTRAREWRPHLFVDPDQMFNIQIPGSPLSVESVVREIVELLPNRRRIVKVSITANPSGKGRVAAVSISGGRSPKHKTCNEEPEGLDKMFECVAVEMMSAIDLLFVASYYLSLEEEQCRNFKVPAASTNPVDEVKQRLVELREHCSFVKTRRAVGGSSIARRTDDLAWVSYIYGKLHLARAEALAKVDQEAQWYEFERAIKRFREFPHNQPPSVKAILMEVYMKNGVAIEDSIKALSWRSHSVTMKHRLALAADILEEAAEELRERPKRSQTLAEAVTAGVEPSWPEKPVQRDRTAALSSHMRGLILYRQWMVDTRSRYEGEEFGFAENEAEKEMLRSASRHFERASRLSRQRFEFFVEWGTRSERCGSTAPPSIATGTPVTSHKATGYRRRASSPRCWRRPGSGPSHPINSRRSGTRRTT